MPRRRDAGVAARAQPQTVTLVGSSCGGEGEGERTLQLALVQPGDLLRVLPGARVPADGAVVSGRSSVDAPPPPLPLSY